MEDKLKEAAAAYSAKKVLRGYWAVDPSGHICLLRPDARIEDGWRWATDADQNKAAAAERERSKAEAEKASEERAKVLADQDAREKASTSGRGPLTDA